MPTSSFYLFMSVNTEVTPPAAQTGETLFPVCQRYKNKVKFYTLVCINDIFTGISNQIAVVF